MRLVHFEWYGSAVGLDTALEGYLFVDRRLDDLMGLLKNTMVGFYGVRGRIGLWVGVYF